MDLLERFREHATWPLRPGERVLSVVLAVALPVAMWDRRGAVAGIVAVFAYGAIFLVGALNQRGMATWQRRHAVLGSLLLVPLVFLAPAYLTSLSLVLCAAAGASAWIVLLPVVLRRRRSAPA